MPYRPPLVPHEYFVADPPELPVRAPGEQGLDALVAGRADRRRTQRRVTLKAHHRPTASTLRCRGRRGRRRA